MCAGGGRTHRTNTTDGTEWNSRGSCPGFVQTNPIGSVQALLPGNWVRFAMSVPLDALLNWVRFAQVFASRPDRGYLGPVSQSPGQGCLNGGIPPAGGFLRPLRTAPADRLPCLDSRRSMLPVCYIKTKIVVMNMRSSRRRGRTIALVSPTRRTHLSNCPECPRADAAAGAVVHPFCPGDLASLWTRRRGRLRMGQECGNGVWFRLGDGHGQSG